MRQPFPILTAEEAADFIQNGQTIGFSGFTSAGSAKAIPAAIARKAKSEHDAGRSFKIGVLTGASTGESLDGALAAAEAISFRTPYQSNAKLRDQINKGEVKFVDMHLSMLQQTVRYGFLGPIHWAIVEACDITAGGGIVLTTSVGASNTFLRLADRIIIELNSKCPATFLGMHDIFEPKDPPVRGGIPIFHASDRIGSPICLIDPNKLVGIVETNLEDDTKTFSEASATTRRIGDFVAQFLVNEMKLGRIPKKFLPLQSGVGDIANSVLASLGENSEVPPFEMYTEVLQDSVLELIQEGKCKFASTSALSLSPDMMRHFSTNIDSFRGKILMRPQEISNHPEVVRRLGIVSMNTALEVDLTGNVNSTHVMGKTLMNGIGGSGDFTRNAYISIFSCPSTAKDGKISTIVPLASHMDHSEHSVQVIVTENGIADLRGKDPRDRAELIIKNCAHPQYREQLYDYMHHLKANQHEPISLSLGLAMHRQFIRHGDMRGIKWSEYA